MDMNLKTNIGKARFYYKLRNMFSLNSKNKELSELQKSVVELAKKILCRKETELLMTPLNHTLYASWKHIIIKISEKGDELILMNGKYYYSFYVPDTEMVSLRKRFYRSLLHRQELWDNKFNIHTLGNVKEVLEEIKQDK